MNARVTFRKDTLSQTGTVGKILMWMQDNENICRDMTYTALANTMAEPIGATTSGVKQALVKMRNNQMVNKSSTGKKRGRIYINYYHKDIPGYILERAPEDVQNKVKAMKNSLENGQYLTDEGVKVTPGDKPKQEEPEEEPKEEHKEEPKLEETKDEQECDGATVAEAIAAAKVAQDLLMPTRIERNGNNISLTININLNGIN